MIPRNSLHAMAAMAMLAGLGSMAGEPSARALEALPETRKRRRATTNAAVPAEPTWVNANVETRQVRRQRERLAAKGRTDRPPSWMLRGSRNASRYMPHIGAKERGRHAA